MKHLREMVQWMDADIKKLVDNQITDRDNPRFGGFLLPNLHVEPRMSGFALGRLALGYMCEESIYYRSTQVETAIKSCLEYMQRHQRPDGCFDLSACNFASPPDTAFMMNAVLNAWWVMEKRQPVHASWLREPLYHLIDTTATGIATGGFHTPNHRWAIAANLMHSAKITGREELADKAREFLHEGLDINEDGEFAERSAGNYNQVNDDQMIRLYLATGDTQFLEAARQNLQMMHAYIDPDDSVFTNNSTRQDHGQKVYLESYYEYFLLIGYLLQDAQMGAMAEWIYQSSKKHLRKPGGVEWLLLYPEMDGFGTEEPLDASFLLYEKQFDASGITRIRRGSFSCTLMTGKADFLYFQQGAMDLCMVIYANLCDKRNFIPTSMEKQEDGSYLLTATSESWYYLPFYPHKPDTSDWWAMDNETIRARVKGLPLHISVRVSIQQHGIDVHLITEGLDQLPLRVEILLPQDSQVRGEQFIITGRAGESITLLSGGVEVTSGKGDLISLYPAFGRHNVQSRSGGAYPQSTSRFTVFLTDYTPTDRTIHIRNLSIHPIP